MCKLKTKPQLQEEDVLQVSEMEAKLKQLDAESDELAKYQAIDRECRSLEYAIHDKEVSDARTKLEEVRQPLFKYLKLLSKV